MSGKKRTIHPFTINMIFKKIEDQRILRSAEGRFSFTREEKVELVFPAMIGDYLRQLSSSSYYSWFLHGQENGGRVRARVEKEFLAHTIQFVQEMAEKCRAFLCPQGHPVLDAAVWKILVDELGQNNPMFVRDGHKSRQLLAMIHAAPHRVLTVMLLAAGMNDFSEEKYESVLACWQLMDRDLAKKDYSQPQEFARTGAILYADGLRQEALASYRKAVRMLEGDIGDHGPENCRDSEGKKLLASMQYRIGEMLLHGDGCSADKDAAEEYLTKSARNGDLHAFYLLAMLLIQSGKNDQAEQILREGAKRKDPACLRALGSAYYSGDTFPGIKKSLNEAVQFYLVGACPDDLSAGDAQCQYMLGRILEESSQDGLAENAVNNISLTGPMAEPSFWLEAAARGGNREAAVLLNRLKWGIRVNTESAFSSASVNKDAIDPWDENPGNNIAAASEFPGPEESANRNLPYQDISSAGIFPADQAVGKKICLLNSDGERNLFFAKTLPADMYSVQICREKSMAGMLRETVEPYLRCGRLRELPEILMMALDDSEAKNMKDSLEILQTAAKLHAETEMLTGTCRHPDRGASGGSGADPDRDSLFYLLSDRLSLYMCGNRQNCSPIIDSVCTQMGDFYIPIYLCDPDQMISFWLLDRMPLFIPCLRGDSSRMDTLIFGDHPGIVRLCKDAFAVAQINGIPFSLTVIGEKADEMEEQFMTDCPGIEDPPAGIEIARPVFIKMRPESRRLQKLLSVRPQKDWTTEEKNLSVILQAADYIVVYAAEESRNLRLSMFLREWYLKTDPSFGRLPFIAAFCDREERAEQFRTLSVGAEAAGFSWYNNYDIRCFGTQRQLYSYQTLVQCRVERRARASYLILRGIRNEEECRETKEGREIRHHALHDYFSRFYNHDISAINALALNYRLFSVGITFPDWHSYLTGISQKRLADQFDKWLRAEYAEGNDIAGEQAAGGKDKTVAGKDAAAGEECMSQTSERRLEVLSMQEHDRWCRAMLSRGWMPASPAQMQAYIQRGCTRYQLYLAKLHPFLCSWEELGEMKPVPTGMQRIYGYLMQQIRPEKESFDIRGIDRENIKGTSYLARIE